MLPYILIGLLTLIITLLAFLMHCQQCELSRLQRQVVDIARSQTVIFPPLEKTQK